MSEQWQVILSREAEKQYKKLKRSGQKKPSVIDLIDAFMVDLSVTGPCLAKWPNYGFIKDKLFYHCHLKKGNPTYVACWIADKNKNIIEVFYVGTHEGAPY